MQLEEPSRILSDIHLGHPASLIGAAENIAPLLRGVPTVIFNGDTVEARFIKDRPAALRDLDSITKVYADGSVHPIFINDTHDPAISPVSHVDLADGAILVTHGDMLFHDVAPWSKQARAMRAAHQQALEEIEGDAFHDFEKRLHANKRASLAL